MFPLNWLTVLKWVGVVAAIVAVIGIPVWYINNKIDSAFQQGVMVGKAECEKEQARLAAEDAAKAAETIKTEAERADTAEKKKNELQRKITSLQEKLHVAVNNKPLPVGCVVNVDATRLLHNAASGDFSLSRAPIPGQLDPTVPGGSSVPGEGGIKSS